MDDHTDERFVRISEVMRIVGFKRSTIYAHMNQGSFPKGFKIGPRAAAWRMSDIKRWMDERTDRSDAA